MQVLLAAKKTDVVQDLSEEKLEGILSSGASSFDYLLRVRQGIEEELDIIKTIRKSNLVTLVTSVDPKNSGALDAMFALDKL